jgi:5'-nucleotidase
MKNEKGEWEGEDVKLASKVKDIDIIISGHTHTYLPEPIMAGKTIIVQAAQYGACVGRLELNVENKEVELVRYDLIPVNDDIPGDPDIHRDIEYAKKYIRERILDDMGLEYNQAVVSTDFDLICDEQGKVEDSNLGPFLADAIRYYINTTEGKHTDMALIAAGVIRDKLAVGTSSIADIFRITSLGKGSDDIPGYPLSMVYVTGNELKKIIEVLLFAYKSSPGNYCYYSGIKVHFDPSKGMLRKVISIEMENEKGTYQPVDFSKNNKTLYSITANAYILEFVGMLKKMTFGIVKVYPKSADGIIIMDMRDAVIDLNTFDKNMQPVVEDLKTFNKEVMEGKEWMATYKFVSRFEDINGDGIPDVPELYKNPPLRVIPVGSNK